MSYIIPPRLRSSDYSKGAITQDEYLRIAAANDANIASARKALKKGEVQQLTPIQDATPDELLADIAKQESDARSNLLRLGFRDQEASSITASLIREQDVLRMFNINYPAIEADIKKRFNPRLITPSFFLEYLREYNENIVASRGLDVNSSASVRRPINALINNVNELRIIMPDPDVIEYIRRTAQEQRFVGQETLNRLEALREVLLGRDRLQNLGSLPPASQYNLIQEITEILRNVPTRAEVDRLAEQVRSGITRDVVERINALAASVPSKSDIEELKDAYNSAGLDISAPPLRRSVTIETEPRRILTPRDTGLPFFPEEEEESASAAMERVRAERDRKAVQTAIDTGADPRRLTREQQILYAEMTGLVRVAPTPEEISSITGATDTSTQSLASSLAIENATLTEIKATFNANPELKDQLKAISNVGMYSVGDKVNYNDLAKSPPIDRPNQRKIFIDDTNLRDIFKAKFGRGLKKSVSTPLKKIKLGKGIAVQELPTYKEFGKYAIHMPQLEQQDILNVKYKSLGGIPKFKPFPISDIFRDFLLDVLDGKRPSERVYLQIEPKERKAFEEIAIGAGVWNSLGLKRTTTNEDEEDRKRFEVLKGIYGAGNNSPQVLQELRRLVTKFINEGKMKRQQGLNLLMELSI